MQKIYCWATGVLSEDTATVSGRAWGMPGDCLGAGQGLQTSMWGGYSHIPRKGILPYIQNSLIGRDSEPEMSARQKYPVLP